MKINPALLKSLARCFLAGGENAKEIAAACGAMLGRRWRWLGPLARRYVDNFALETRPRQRDVIRFLRGDAGFQSACVKYSGKLRVEQWFTGPGKMKPAEAAGKWDVPAIETAGALAEWLQLSVGELGWFADLKGLGYKNNAGKLRHYHYRLLAKRFGSVRLIEAPKPRLKEIQRRILAGILEGIPTHPAAHGFVKGRSVKSFLAAHTGQRVVLRMDLEDFFPSFAGARIQAFFRTAGYPEAVADLLGGLCTNAAPREIWKQAPFGNAAQAQEARALYGRPHLPQGAPSSPALANLCAYRVDCRLQGLARGAGAEYTRYADDLAFSGREEFEKCAERFSIQAAAILMDEGFTVHHRKTRIMRQGVRQQLAGVVVNRHANIRRADFDRLKATLTNCARLDPASQNRGGQAFFRAHLAGRVAWVESINPARGKRLRRIFEQVRWPEP